MLYQFQDESVDEEYNDFDDKYDSHTDHDEYVMNQDDCADPRDVYDIEYDC